MHVVVSDADVENEALDKIAQGGACQGLVDGACDVCESVVIVFESWRLTVDLIEILDVNPGAATGSIEAAHEQRRPLQCGGLARKSVDLRKFRQTNLRSFDAHAPSVAFR